MITLVAYIALRCWFNDDWSGWLLVLPIITDLILIERVGK